MTEREAAILEGRRSALASHVQAMGYPLAAEVIRAGDELPELDPDAVYVPTEQGRLPLAELPAVGQEALEL